jgi:hypothetical protein
VSKDICGIMSILTATSSSEADQRKLQGATHIPSCFLCGQRYDWLRTTIGMHAKVGIFPSRGVQDYMSGHVKNIDIRPFCGRP